MVLRYWSGRLALVLCLSVAVVGWTGGRADALALPPGIDKATLAGAEVAAGKGVLKGVLAHAGPVGNILTAASLAWWGYSEVDGLIHGRQPGGNPSDYLGAGGSYANPASDGIITVSIDSVNVRTVTYTIKCNAYAWNATLAANTCAGVYPAFSFARAATSSGLPGTVDCRSPGGTVTRRTFSTSMTTGATSSATTGTTGTFALCNSGETPDGFRIDPTPNEGGTKHLMVGIGWGTLIKGVLPSGSVTFQNAVIDATCKNAVTGATQHIVVSTAWGTSETLAVPSCKARLGKDWYGTGLKVIPMDPSIGAIPLDPGVWPGWSDIPSTVPEIWAQPDPDPAKPEEAQPCYTAAGGCGLTLWIDGQICTVGNSVCTKADEVQKKDPTRVECRSGTVVVAYERCKPILGTFDQPKQVDPSIDPENPPNPVPGCTTGCVPTEPKIPDPETKSCMAAAVSWNPVDWIYTPVKCAMQWAFKPKTPFSTRVTRVKTAFESKPPFSWLIGIGALPPVSGGSCPTNWQFAYKGHSYPVLCGTAMGNGVRNMRPLFVVLLVGAACYPFLRSLVYAAFPIIKPVPND